MRRVSNREADADIEFGTVRELVEVDGVSLAFVQCMHYEAMACGRWVALRGDSALKLVRLQSIQCATAHSADVAYVPYDDRAAAVDKMCARVHMFASIARPFCHLVLSCVITRVVIVRPLLVCYDVVGSCMYVCMLCCRMCYVMMSYVMMSYVKML